MSDEFDRSRRSTRHLRPVSPLRTGPLWRRADAAADHIEELAAKIVELEKRLDATEEPAQRQPKLVRKMRAQGHVRVDD